MHTDSICWLKETLSQSFDGKTFIVTHHLPSVKSLKPGDMDDFIHASYCSDFERLIHEYEPDLWVHGHRHIKKDYQIGKTRIVCNPREYAGEKEVEGFDPDMVVEL